MKPGMSSTPTDLEGVRSLTAVKISESETAVRDNNSENEERVGKTIGHGLLYTD
jgi:hypothetical protein